MDFPHLILQYLRENGYSGAHLQHGHSLNGNRDVVAVQIGINSPYIICFMLDTPTQMVYVRRLEKEPIERMGTRWLGERIVTSELCSVTDPTALEQILKKVKETPLAR